MAQLVARSVRDAEVVGSSPITLTIFVDRMVVNVYGLENVFVFYVDSRGLYFGFSYASVVHETKKELYAK